MHVAIVGGGILGCSISWALRRAGADATVIDRHGEVGHGSTSASCGIVRRFYSQPGMIALAHEASHLWADWGAHLGPIEDELARFERPGVLLIPPAIDASVHAIIARMKECGVAVQLLDADAAEARFPFLCADSFFPPVPTADPDFFEPTGKRIAGAVFEEDGGYVVSPSLAAHNLRLAGERDGVQFRLGTTLVGVERPDGGPFLLRTADGGTIEADAVVNAAGPHSGLVNRMGGVTLPLETRPLRREVHAMKNPRYEAGGGVPVVGDLDGGIYFRPESRCRDLIVGSADPACDAFEWVDDPDDYNESISDLVHDRQTLRLMKRFPDVQRGPARGLGALYDVTVADWYPIIDKTDLDGWYVAMGTSGSSFKTAPVIGPLVAKLVMECEGGRDHDVDPVVLDLPRTGLRVDASFLSRLRQANATTGTVIG
ncbi:MAG: FAD-binding oxidoreductase [Proteobacteria bacterium]|nr:FAD-binding oxidoreductase [Pseudomonadota bacterium]